MIVYRSEMRVLVVLVMFALGCSGAGRTQVKRWPYHREEREAQFLELQSKIEELQRRVARLEAAKKAPVPVVAPPVETPPATEP